MTPDWDLVGSPTPWRAEPSQRGPGWVVRDVRGAIVAAAMSEAVATFLADQAIAEESAAQRAADAEEALREAATEVDEMQDDIERLTAERDEARKLVRNLLRSVRNAKLAAKSWVAEEAG